MDHFTQIHKTEHVGGISSLLALGELPWGRRWEMDDEESTRNEYFIWSK